MKTRLKISCTVILHSCALSCWPVSPLPPPRPDRSMKVLQKHLQKWCISRVLPLNNEKAYLYWKSFWKQLLFVDLGLLSHQRKKKKVCTAFFYFSILCISICIVLDHRESNQDDRAKLQAVWKWVSVNCCRLQEEIIVDWGEKSLGNQF